MDTNAEKDIFISYSRTDFEKIAFYIRRLTLRGYTIWLDQWQIFAGDNFQSKYHLGIETTSLVVLFASKHSMMSPWVHDEMSRTSLSAKPLLIVRLDETDINLSWIVNIKEVNYVNCVDGTDETFELFLNTVHSFFPNKDELFDVYTSDYNRITNGEQSIMSELQHAAEDGDVSAQSILAAFYLNGGELIEKDFTKAEFWLTKAALKGDALSEYSLGLLNLPNSGVKDDLFESYYWFRRAALHGVNQAYLQIANILKSGSGILDDKDKALQSLAQSGNNSPFVKGMMADILLAKGETSKGIELLKESSEYEPQAMFNLALLYAKGDIVEQDYIQAYDLFKKAAQLGDIKSKANVGDMLIRGLGVTQDIDEGISTLIEAAEDGDPGGQYSLGMYYYMGEYVAKDFHLAVYWFKKAYDSGEFHAADPLGSCYYHGVGVSRDYKQAAYYWSEGAKKGLAYSQYGLGLLYYYGHGLFTSFETAAHWLKSAKALGQPIPYDIEMSLGI